MLCLEQRSSEKGRSFPFSTLLCYWLSVHSHKYLLPVLLITKTLYNIVLEVWGGKLCSCLSPNPNIEESIYAINSWPQTLCLSLTWFPRVNLRIRISSVHGEPRFNEVQAIALVVIVQEPWQAKPGVVFIELKPTFKESENWSVIINRISPV